ncbi:MAG: sensor histidine kinase [Streptosporangiaceae bacterium]
MIGVAQRARGSSRAAARDNEVMLRAANWTVRVALLVLVGCLTFTAHWSGRVAFAAQVVAFTLGTLVMACWALGDLRPSFRARYARLQPYALGAVTLTSAAASAKGGSLIYLGLAAALVAASETSLVTAWTVTGLGMLGAVAAGLAVGAGIWVIAANCGGLLIFLLLGLNRRSSRIQAEQSAALLAKAEQLNDEHARLATLQERTRIAREIHDVLAHSLGALGVQIQVARAVLTDRHDVPRAVELLDQAHRMATDGLTETRRAVHALRGETLPLPAGLAELSAGHQRRHGAPVSFEVRGVPRPLSPDAGLAITRTAQEALVNTAKHAPHQPVEIRLDYTDADTSLRVTNLLGAAGHDAQEAGLATVNGRYGLAGMRERLLLLHGTLSARRDGGTWVVEARVPQ